MILSVKNISPTESITFYLDAMRLNASSIEGHIAHQHHSRSTYLWSGVSRFNSVTLAPRAETSYTLYAAFPRPGVYNINRFKLVVKTDAGRGDGSGAPVPHKDVYPSAPYLVTVEDESAAPAAAAAM